MTSSAAPTIKNTPDRPGLALTNRPMTATKRQIAPLSTRRALAPQISRRARSRRTNSVFPYTADEAHRAALLVGDFMHYVSRSTARSVPDHASPDERHQTPRAGLVLQVCVTE